MNLEHLTKGDLVILKGRESLGPLEVDSIFDDTAYLFTEEGDGLKADLDDLTLYSDHAPEPYAQPGRLPSAGEVAAFIACCIGILALCVAAGGIR
jgi:hypothetical protein